MPEMRDILSPLATPNIQRTPVFSHVPCISPSTSRSHVGLKSPTATLLEGDHDEAAEKRERRRRSRVMQLQQRTIESPVSPVDRRRSLTLNGLSSAQIAEHYANCIKLSAENKITSKNAFGLHLIDYMSDQLKKKELENFQVASTTLDASAKIYAGRVDAIHTETYKVLSGLGRSSDKNKPDEEQEKEDAGDAETPGEEVTKKKKKSKKKNTVEANIKNIDMKEKDFEVKADPLFQMMSATFDEGGISSLLLNGLRCFDDQQGLALDSGTLIGPCLDVNECSQRQTNDLGEITDMAKGHDLGPLELCPTFSSFSWDDASETSILPTGSSTQAFDMDAEPEPIHDMDDDNGHDLPEMDELDMEDHGNADSDTSHCEGDADGAPDKGISLADGKAAQLMDTVMKDLANGSTGSLMQVLAAEPSDYSFFNKTLLRTWAGPEHWKKGPIGRDSKANSKTEKSQAKTKKPAFKIDYDQEIDFEKSFKPSKSVTLTKATLSKNGKTNKTLPKYLHYETDKLFRLFVKSKLMIKRQNTSSENLDDGIENYDYENVNDRENFCPRDIEGNDADDDDEGEGFDFTAGCSEFSQSQDSQDFGSQPDHLDGTILTGDKLVAQPHKVAKIDISYAKAAKKLDVKRLKTTMWDIMTHEAIKASEEQSTEENTNASASTENEMKGTCTFQDILNIIPSKVSDQTAKNLSVPIAFACLLHLANEKRVQNLTQEEAESLGAGDEGDSAVICLKISSVGDDLGNLCIMQGI